MESFKSFSYVLTLILIGQITDCYTTLLFIPHGCELNPIMNAILSIDPVAYITVKFIGALSLLILLIVIRFLNPIWAKRTAIIVLMLSLLPPIFNIGMNTI